MLIVRSIPLDALPLGNGNESMRLTYLVGMAQSPSLVRARLCHVALVSLDTTGANKCTQLLRLGHPGGLPRLPTRSSHFLPRPS